MENSSKRGFVNLVYYSLIVLSLLLTGLFLWRIIMSNVPMYIQVLYGIWAAILILTIIYDIFCTLSGRMKYISALILYLLALIAVIMAIVLFFALGMNTAFGTFTEVRYIGLLLLSFTSVVVSIVAYCTGKRVSMDME